jgi:multiple sugar transport system substrate-binding protein
MSKARGFLRHRGLAIAGAALLTVPACGLFTGGPGGGGSNEAPGTVVVALPADDPGAIAARQELAEQFMEDHPDIPVKIQTIPADGYDQKVFTSIAAGNPPDIFGSGDVIIPTIVSKGYAVDLNKFVERDNFNLNAFYPDVVEGLTFEGQLVGLTDNWDTQIMYYNRDLFDAAGLEYPDGTWTWDDFVSAGRQLTEGEGPKKIYGAVHGTWFAPVFNSIWANGGDILNEDATKCVIDSPQATEAIQNVADLIDEGLSPTPSQLEGQSPVQLMLSGRAAMFIDAGRWAAYELQEAGDRVDWAVAPVPKGSEGRANFFHLAMFAIAENSDSQENAWEFLKFMVSKEASKVLLANAQGIPARKKLATAPSFKNDPIVKQHNTLQPFLESLPTAHKAPYVVDFPVYLDTIERGIDPVWAGDKTAAEVLPGVCDKVDDQLQQAQEQQ